jgi:hypothetical protein
VIALPSAERDVALALMLLNHARRNYDDCFGDVMLAVDDPLSGVAEYVRGTLDIARASLDDCEAAYHEAFDRLAALRFAASPLVLVPRALTPDEARSLDIAQRHLRIVRGMHRIFLRSLWEAQGRLLAAIASGDAEAEDRARTTIAFDTEDIARNPVSAALDARAPLLAAQWEAA